MSWFTDLAGRAETILNKLDSEAATVLSNSERRHSLTSSTTTSTTSSSRPAHHNPVPPPPTTTQTKSGLHGSTSVPSNLSSYGSSSPSRHHPTTTTTTTQGEGSPPKSWLGRQRGARRREKEAREEGLMELLNSPLDTNPLPPSSLSPTPTTTTTSTTTQATDPMTSSVSLTISTLSSLGHSRQSSMSSVSSLMALSGRETPASVTHDIESGSCESGGSSGGSGNTDAYVTIETPSDVAISAPPSTDGSTSNGGLMTGSVDSETCLLRKEVTSLNQEMNQVLQRAKEAEREALQLRNQMSGMLSQQSVSDRLLREIQQREMDLQESLKAKDSQLAVLRVRLQEADDGLRTREASLADLQSENKRVLEGATESSGLHNQALQTLQERLAHTQAALDQQQQQHAAQHHQLTTRVGELEEEQERLSVALSDAHRRLEEEKTRSHQLHSQLSGLRGELSGAREELVEYKAKASRILQSKDKLIASLKDSHGSQGLGGQASADLHQAELHQIRAERDLLREELEGAQGQLQRLEGEVGEAEAAARDAATLAAHNARTLEDSLAEERQRRREGEAELRQAQEEMRCVHEELTKQKVNISSRLHERDTEIDRLRKQVAHKQSSSSSQVELEQRVLALTESLIHKQTSIETLSTEKHSLCIQMERLQQQYEESQQMLNRDTSTLHRQDDVRNRVPSFLVESPFDGGVARRVKRAYSTLDKFSVRLGVFLRRYPIARVFVIVYMCLLHLWVMVVLLTYTPEIHGADYHHLPIATLPQMKGAGQVQ